MPDIELSAAPTDQAAPIEVLRELRASIAGEREFGHNAADRERSHRLRLIDAAIASLSALSSGPVECDGLTEHEFRAVWLAASAEDRQLMRDEIAKHPASEELNPKKLRTS